VYTNFCIWFQMPFADGHAPLTQTHTQRLRKWEEQKNNQVEYDDDDAITLFSSMCHPANIVALFISV
jgi:hypothetical protein